MHAKSWLAIFILFAGIHSANAQVEAPTKDDSPFTKTKAELVKSGHLQIESIVYVPVIEERVIREGDKEKTVRLTRTIPEMRVRIIAKGAFQVIGVGGMPIGDMAIAKALSKKRVVYLIRGDKIPMGDQLKKLGPDALFVLQISNNPK